MAKCLCILGKQTIPLSTCTGLTLNRDRQYVCEICSKSVFGSLALQHHTDTLTLEKGTLYTVYVTDVLQGRIHEDIIYTHKQKNGLFSVNCATKVFIIVIPQSHMNMSVQGRNLSQVKLVTNISPKQCTFQPTLIFISVRNCIGLKNIKHFLHKVRIYLVICPHTQIFEINICWVGVKNVASPKGGITEEGSYRFK